MHLIYRFQEGGAERVVWNIAAGLRGSTIESSICSTVPASSLKALLDRDIPLFELRRRPGNDPSFVWQLYRLLRRQRPHILQTHSWGTLCEGLIAGRMARVPIIIHLEHGTLQTKNYQRRVQRWAWPRADRLLAVCSQLGDRMAHTVAVPGVPFGLSATASTSSVFKDSTAMTRERTSGCRPMRSSSERWDAWRM